MIPKALTYNGLRVVPNMYISDVETVERSWKERLFTFPWEPFKKYKEVYNPRVWLVGDDILVSYETYSRMMKETNGI